MSQIPRIILDPYSDEEVLEQMFIRAEASSGGQLTDFRQGSVVAALYEGVEYTFAELSWYLNLLPEALALEVMRYSTGLERIDGTHAKGDFTFSLTSIRGSDFYIGKDDIRIPWKDSYFVLENDLIIPAGLIEASAVCRCVSTGTEYNVPRTLDINHTPSFNGLARVFNTLPITNATDLEPLPLTLSRMQAAIRSGGVLITTDDYELKLSELAGNGSRAKVIPLLDNNLVANTTGHIHAFVVMPDGLLPSSAQCASLKSDLDGFTFEGVFSWVSPAHYDPVNIDIVIQVTDISDSLAESIADSIRTFFSFREYPMGEAVILDNLKYVIRRDNEADIRSILSLTINGDSTDLPLTHQWTLPSIDAIDITLVDGEGTKTYIKGDIVEDIL